MRVSGDGYSAVIVPCIRCRPELFGSQRSDVHKTALGGLLHNHELCDFEAVVIISHPGVRSFYVPSVCLREFITFALNPASC